MKKFLIGSAASLIMLGAMAIPAFAAGKVVHYGPIASTSPDSSTCGNDWATDTFDRFFQVTTVPNPDGTYDVTQEFKNGTFVTLEGNSPGGCDTNPGGTVGAGITGKMHGSFTMVVTGGTYDPEATCETGCDTTAGFVTTVFGAGATYDVPSFIFHYSAGSFGEWKNASADYGGNHGDITGTLDGVVI